jgi:hypothetical protein
MFDAIVKPFVAIFTVTEGWVTRVQAGVSSRAVNGLMALCQGLNDFPFLHPGCFRRGSGIGVADPKLHLTQIQTAPLPMSSIS